MLSTRSVPVKLLVTAGLASAATLALAGCTSNSVGTSPAAASASAGKQLSIVVVAGPLDDPYFGAMKTGADEAGTQLNAKVKYLSPSSSKEGSGPTLARLIQDGINMKPDAMVISNFFPDAEDPVIKQATSSGIPVTIINGGVDTWKADGAQTYVGLDAAPIGTSVASAMKTLGVKKALCVNSVPGNPFLETVCKGLVDGMKAAGLDGSTLNIPYADATDPTKTQAEIAGTLKANPGVDGIFTFSNPAYVQAAADQAGVKAQIGTGSIATQTLKDIVAGKIAFALDSQPYLQSYYGVLTMAQFVRYGMMPAPIMTGPQIVTKDNAGQVQKINDETKGIRGAA